MDDDLTIGGDGFDDLPDEIVDDGREQTKYDCHCPDCDREFPGGDRAGGHCTVCHMSFTANAGFDRHRVGKYSEGRRCRTPDELLELGWSVSGDGNQVWRLPGATGAPWWEKHDNNSEGESNAQD